MQNDRSVHLRVIGARNSIGTLNFALPLCFPTHTMVQARVSEAEEHWHILPL